MGPKLDFPHIWYILVEGCQNIDDG